MTTLRSLPIFLGVLLAGCAAESSGADEVVDETSEEALTRAQCRGAIGETEAKCRLEGVVESVFAGEVDPSVIGDACITFVKVGYPPHLDWSRSGTQSDPQATTK